MNFTQKQIRIYAMVALLAGAYGTAAYGQVKRTWLGENVQATASHSTAIGANSKATGYNSTAVGADNSASESHATAIGSDSQASGASSTALGQGSRATALSSTALGSSSRATGTQSTASGAYANATGTQSTAFGAESQATGQAGVALGLQSKATNYATTATGYGSEATGHLSTATGSASRAIGANSTALGNGTNASGASATALGADANASGTSSVALGRNSVATEANTVSVGSSTIKRRIVNVTNGIASNDAATVGQVNRSVTTNSVAGTATLKDANGSTKATVYTKDKVDSLLSSAAMKGAKGDKGDKGDRGLQGLRGIQGVAGAKGDKGDKGDQGIQGVAGAKGDKGDKGAGIVVNNGEGTATIAEDTDSTKAATVYTKAGTDNLLKDKADSAAVEANTTAIGDASSGLVKKTNRTRRMVKQINEHLGIGGKRSVKDADNATVLSAGREITSADETSEKDTITGAAVVLSTDKAAIERADGTEALAATNTGTVLKGGTGTTLQTLRDQDKGVAAGTGNSGVSYQTTMYGLNGDNNAEYTTDATAFNTFNTNGTLPADAPAGATGIINEGGVYKYVTNVRLGGVAAGVKANDAVNKGQLDAVLQDVQAADQRITANTQGIANNSKRIDSNTQGIANNSKRIDNNTQGIANVAAIAGMPALPAGADGGFSAGVGHYGGKSAVAIGFQHRLNANTTFKMAAATSSNGKPAVSTGFSYSWGGASPDATGQSQQVVALQDQLRIQATENAGLMAQQTAQAAEIEELKHQRQAQATENAGLKWQQANLAAEIDELKHQRMAQAAEIQELKRLISVVLASQ
ncbi:MAG: YadA-like family protein [Burkholderiaceae bacterium]